MGRLFNISERFSKSLDDVRGPERRNRFLKHARAWIQPSGARRAVARVLAFGGVSLGIGALGVYFYKNRRQLRKPVVKIEKPIFRGWEDQRRDQGVRIAG